MVVNVTKIYQQMKKKSFLSIEKNIIEWEKCLIIIIRKCFNLENFASLRGKVSEAFFFCKYVWKVLAKNVKKMWEIFEFQALQVHSRNIRSFLSLGLESSISQNKNIFLCFWFLKYKSSILLRTFKKIFRVFAKRSIVDDWQCSEYAAGSIYAMVLNIPFLKYKKVLLSEN